MSIRLLPQSIVLRLAAGEVVERPASAVKELLDNAIDAGARQIVISYRRGGLAGLVVEDDGDGMSPEDLALCTRPHATSKLDDETDLSTATLGFRGEALAAIAAVSRVIITTRRRDDSNGWSVSNAYGWVPSAPRPSSARVGTRVEVTDIFRKAPARLRFLSSERTEASRIRSMVRQAALANPDVGFTVVAAGTRLLRVDPAFTEEEERARLKVLLGKEYAAEALPLLPTGNDQVTVTGWLRVPPAGTRSSDERRQIVVNGRPVRDRKLNATVARAVAASLGRDLAAEAVLRVQVPRQEVNANIHPAKEEVRFACEEAVRAAVTESIKRTLKDGGMTAAPRLAAAAREAATRHQGEEVDHLRRPLGRPIGQAHRAWVICETADGLAIVDQHAAHERIILERLRAQLAEETVEKRELARPHVADLSHAEAACLLDASQPLSRRGLELEEFGAGSLLVRSVPSLLGPVPIDPFLRDLARITDECGPEALEDRLDEVVAAAACRAAIKAGDALDPDRLAVFLREIEDTPNGVRCNHGRPAVAFLSNDDLERLFDRR